LCNLPEPEYTNILLKCIFDAKMDFRPLSLTTSYLEVTHKMVFMNTAKREREYNPHCASQRI